MSLQITMLKAPASVAVAESPLSLGEPGGTLGRGAGNSLVLEDPELYLSTLHCQISLENGSYYLIDHSTNGTFYGGSTDPMGKGSKIPVHDNDHFVIGDYEFVISITSAPSAMSADPFAGQAAESSMPQDDPLQTPPAADNLDGFAANPFAGGHVSSKDSLFAAGPSDSDPLAALDKARGGSATPSPAIDPLPSSDPFAGATHSDGAGSLNQQIEWPQPASPQQASPQAGMIPDDWDDESPGTSPAEPESATDGVAPTPLPDPAPVSQSGPERIATAKVNPEIQLRQQELAQANVKLRAEVEQLKQQLAAQPGASAGDKSVDTTFIDALGFADRNLSDAEISEINRLAGEALREMVIGLMRVLGSRNSIKNEFRMNVTTIQPVENNPLKFSANVDDALENMFLKQGNAFKKPIESVREGFEGIAEHQVAILAGIREAFKVVIGRFDPVLLEENFSKHNKGGLLPGSQKAKNWEAYLDYYEDLAGDADKSFQYLFGDGFVRAYEDQLQKLAITRKSRQNDNET